MNDSIASHLSGKALPPLAKHDDLPPPPPPPRDEAPPPMLPPKITLDHLPSPTTGPRSASLPKSPDALSLPGVTSPPGSPMSFTSFGPPSPTSATPADRPKKSNPFVDLIETEKSYVDILSGIIRKVASAWSRSNLPPSELDIMFRSIEAIFKANRSFYSKLKEIGPNPSSPRAIGDLLMKWVDQLDSPYTSYCSSYLTGFDSWEPVTSNQRLPGILSAFSSSNPPFQSNLQVWTMDTLLALPRSRIKYYQKLYSRLLKNSAPGRSTDKKLIEVNEKLERLLTIAEERSSIPLPGSDHVIETTDEVVIGSSDVPEVPPKVDTETTNITETKESSLKKISPVESEMRTSLESSARGSVQSGSQTSSRETPLTSDGRASTATLSMSLSDLESRLAVERCRDLFTMNLRSVRLSLNSPNIPYTREIRLSEDAVISFTPKSTNIGIVHRQGRIFLLTDLFLICERMTQEDRNRCDSENTDMWLCYPPLAAKHIRVSCIEDDKLEIIILKKEVMMFQFDSQGRRDHVFREFVATSTAAATLPPPSKQAPPPVPPLGNIIQSQSIPSSRNSESTSDFDGSSRIASPVSVDNATRTFGSSRPSSEGTSRSGSAGPTPSHEFERPGPPPYSANIPSEPDSRSGFPGRSFSNGETFRPPPRGESSRSPPIQPVIGGAGNFSSLPDMREPASFSPGQIIPPHRSGSIGSGLPHGGPFPPRGPSAPPVNGGPYPAGGMPPIGGMSSPPPRNMMSPPPMNGMNGPSPQRVMMSPPPGSGGPMQGPPHMAGYGPMHGGPPGAITVPPRSGSLGPQPMSAGPRPDFMQGRPGPGPPMQQGLPPHPGAPFAQPGRPSSDPSFQGGIRKTPSLHSLSSQHDSQRSLHAAADIPPMPNRPDFNEGGSTNHLRPMLPSAALPRIASGMAPQFGIEDSPPTSPTEQAAPTGPVETSIRASMKCKVFLQQQHAQWKSLGSAKLTLYEQQPTNVKQLVVEADNKDKTMLISTIVLTDGVERVGKTGVAIELSDNGARTGIIYMIQLRNEKSAGGLFDSLLVGSDRGGR